MKQAMLDIDLLRSFVSVVDAGGFTRAGERVHRTQSTVSQQIRRLEETLGPELLSEFARSRPGLRLHVRSGLSVRLASDLERGEFDLALFKRAAGGHGGI